MTTPPALSTGQRAPYWCDPHPADADLVPRDGRRHLGVLEQVVRRQWNPAEGPPPSQLIAAVDRLAALPGPIASLVADTLTGGLWLGVGNAPALDHLRYLTGRPVRPGIDQLWDQVPGAVVWGRRTVVVGTGPHVSVSLVDHEIGHVIERRRRAAESAEWQTIMMRCRPLLVYQRWQDPLEWWAEAWALVINHELDWLSRHLSGSIPVTEMVARYYVRHYGLEV
ncbi:hypothetical protein [Actinomadura kijaniata]|uniref:hypothetical protein n=1 Tax=Actinomadura kijaniata TaxID=46161 RepID=UPI000A3EE966|nr:hypothetical protein [Actinomadura kijaniata]